MGWDSREDVAYQVAQKSCRANSSRRVEIHPLKAPDLYARRMLWRPVERDDGQTIDHLSNAPQSTEFATSRFLVPFLHRKGWALFADCDVVFLGDVAELFALTDDRCAVMVVKHQHNPSETTKMDGQPQLAYYRKNWSSVILWNCDHPANMRLTLGMVNWWPGSCLHRFCWLKDEEIGSLPSEYNWLVNVEPKPAEPRIVHFTLGGPWLPGWTPKEHDEIWLEANK
jgi:lipopolysaccharide biosynthesis glycosyltransferase